MSNKSTLDLIREVLEPLDEHIAYGTITNLPSSERWDYTVFGRSEAEPSQNKTSITHYYTVAVVREDYVPEPYIHKVIAAMRSIPGMKWIDAQFDYTTKTGTQLVVELMVLRFIKAEKLEDA